jgi:LmbE family N-acetylglucosaminyl deacetylase
MKKNILVLAAHPDDEALGCGGTIAKYVRQGFFVHTAFLADGINSRGVDQNQLVARRDAARAALATLGVDSVSFSDFPDNQMDTVATIKIAIVIENLISKYSPDVVLTHHFGDVNVDHQKVHEATVVACRPQPGNPVKKILCYEVASSTEWQLSDKSQCFSPNYFVDISDFLEKKIKSLDEYEHEMRSWPHPRSINAVKYLAHWRGSTVGVDAAEAFMVGRIIE